ncbi:unnamed protein product [Pleuronectes platessa]|uniref:Uncharacterized protein n=1 Tax=Pleuronectes platessa TaxID=8262 RepID=A0A9N7UKL7_PLEPL|nr:unnamed protein product [Pleuronectes platessa]
MKLENPVAVRFEPCEGAERAQPPSLEEGTDCGLRRLQSQSSQTNKTTYDDVIRVKPGGDDRGGKPDSSHVLAVTPVTSPHSDNQARARRPDTEQPTEMRELLMVNTAQTRTSGFAMEVVTRCQSNGQLFLKVYHKSCGVLDDVSRVRADSSSPGSTVCERLRSGGAEAHTAASS